jgi:hypothetical protein
MKIPNYASPHALYSVGGRLYKTNRLTTTSLRLEDLLDGQFLLFKLDEAHLMIQQQDLIKVKRSTLRRLCETDPQYRRHMPSWEQVEKHESLAGSADHWAKLPQLQSVVPHDSPSDVDPRCKGVMEQRNRYAKRIYLAHDFPTIRQGRSALERVNLLILDEYSYFTQKSDVLTQEETHAMLNVYVMPLRQCPFSYIRTLSLRSIQDWFDAVSKYRWLSESRMSASKSPLHQDARRKGRDGKPPNPKFPSLSS